MASKEDRPTTTPSRETVTYLNYLALVARAVRFYNNYRLHQIRVYGAWETVLRNVHYRWSLIFKVIEDDMARRGVTMSSNITLRVTYTQHVLKWHIMMAGTADRFYNFLVVGAFLGLGEIQFDTLYNWLTPEERLELPVRRGGAAQCSDHELVHNEQLKPTGGEFLADKKSDEGRPREPAEGHEGTQAVLGRYF